MRGSRNADRTKSPGRSRKTSPAALPGETTLAGFARSEGGSKRRARGAGRRGERSPLVPAPQSGELDALAEVGRHALRSDACLLRLEAADGELTFVSGRSSADEAAVLAAFPGGASAPATSTKAVWLSIPILRGGRPAGALAAFRISGEAYAVEDEEVAGLLAQQAVRLLDRADEQNRLQRLSAGWPNWRGGWPPPGGRPGLDGAGGCQGGAGRPGIRRFGALPSQPRRQSDSADLHGWPCPRIAPVPAALAGRNLGCVVGRSAQ